MRSRMYRRKYSRPYPENARRVLVAVALATALAATACAPGGPSGPEADRVDLRVLVVSDGSEPVEAIRDRLAVEGVPHVVVDLDDPGRPVLTDAFLSDVVATGPRGKFQAVVVPNEDALPESERAALNSYESRFSIREVLAYTWAHPAVGLNYADDPGYVGTLDGLEAALTPTAVDASFAYLNGQVDFPDVDGGVSETYGYLGVPLDYPVGSPDGFVPLLTAPISGAAERGVLMGQHSAEGRERLVITFDYNASQPHFALLAHGIIGWMTRGTHLGINRNYLSVHIDDVLLPDSRWSTEANCTPHDDCPLGSGVSTSDIRMVADDVSYLAAWQANNGAKLDVVFNAEGSVEAIAEGGSDPLTDELLIRKDDMRWINHTYSHTYLGCEQDFTVIPWQCATDASGVVWTSQAEIALEISQNLAWAASNGVTVPADLLVSGEHSGLASAPQMPIDNPNFVGALADLGITATASDASREHAPRLLEGQSTFTVPRYPMNIFYNVGTVEEEIDEYNWIYTRQSDGGSGICELFPEITTCIEPLPLVPSSFFDYIVPIEADQVFSHLVSNDPRPHYAHQSNLTEDRILYPVLDGALTRYNEYFASNAPFINPSYAETFQELRLQSNWDENLNGGVSAYLLDGTIIVDNATGGAVDVPLTLPDGPGVTHDYGGEESGWIVVPAGQITAGAVWG